MAYTFPRTKHTLPDEVAIHIAAERGVLSDLDDLLARGVDPNLVRSGPSGDTPMTCAGRFEQVEACIRLFIAGADPDRLDRSNCGIVYYALLFGNERLTLACVAFGANMNPVEAPQEFKSPPMQKALLCSPLKAAVRLRSPELVLHILNDPHRGPQAALDIASVLSYANTRKYLECESVLRSWMSKRSAEQALRAASLDTLQTAPDAVTVDAFTRRRSP